MKNDLTGIASRVFNAPLAIWPSKGDVILNVLESRLGIIGAPTAPAALLDVKKADRDSLAMTPDGVAVIDVCGTLVRKASGLDALSGLTSYVEIESDVQKAIDDPACRGILLSFDSPGGEVGGLFDLCAKLSGFAKQKPMWASVSEMACSAAYAIASCCAKIFITQTAAVGSIGVYALHVDRSGMDKQAGLKFTYIQAGEKKTEGNPHEPLSSEAKDTIQAEIDRTYGIFVDLVAINRKVSARAVKATQAGVYFAEDAIQAKLADQIGTTEDALEAMRASLPPGIGAGILRAEGKLLAAALAAMPDEQESEDPAEDLPTEDPNDIEEDNEDPVLPVDEESKAAAAEAEIPKKESAAMSQPDTAPVAAPTAPAAMDVQRINALCKIANRTDLLSDFIEKGLTAAEVEEELMKLASDESTKYRIDSRNGLKPAKSSGIAGIRQMLAESQAAAAQNEGLTKEQAFTRMLVKNPGIYAEYKQQKAAAAFRLNCGDATASAELMALVEVK